MTIGRINEELDNLIYYIDEYQKAKLDLNKSISKTQFDDANYDMELNLLAIEKVFNLNHELKEVIFPRATIKNECIDGSFLTVNFVTDVKNYIQKVKNYA